MITIHKANFNLRILKTSLLRYVTAKSYKKISNHSTTLLCSHMEVRNIVAITDFGCQLNLRDINLKIPETTYNPSKFSGLTLRIKTPKATAQIFRTGKIVCLWTKNETELHLAGCEFAKILIRLGYNAVFTGFTIKNLVASCNVGFKIHLETIVGGIYTPELFPALNYKLNNVTLLIFQSGKVIATGAKTKEEIDKTYDKLFPVLSRNI